jgi:hydroxymethylbilane synthase
MANKLQTIRIATRTSKLALWQAETVKENLERSGHQCELIFIESTGDMQLTQPLYALGVSGVFTKQLDIALLEGKADIAVHSLKDVPTQIAQGLKLISVLERGAHQDVALIKDRSIFDRGHKATIATSSLRRRAQWLAQYPAHTTASIRGNVQTRLRKFAENEGMDGVIFAKAGLERLGLLPSDAIVLDWMIPAPAQGIVGIVCREDDTISSDICSRINHNESFIAGYIERQFLSTLMGGCSVPLSAYASVSEERIHFTGAMHSFDGDNFYKVEKDFDRTDWKNAGQLAASELLSQSGARELLEEIRNKKWSNENTID